MATPELDIENYCRDWVEWKEGKLIKVATPGTRGFVDRLLLLPGVPITIYVEFKKPGENPRKNQRRWHKELARLCKTTWIIDDIDEFIHRAQRTMEHYHAGIPRSGHSSTSSD